MIEVPKASTYYNVLELLLSYCNIKDDLFKLKLTDNSNLTLSINGIEYTELPTIIIYIIEKSESANILYPKDNITRSKIDQWISLINRNDYMISDLDSIKEIDSALVNTTFLVSDNITLADVIMYPSLFHWVKKSTFKEKEILFNLSRWYDNMQHLPGISTGRFIDMPKGSTLKDMSSLMDSVDVVKKKDKSQVKNVVKKPQNNNERPIDDITRLAVRVGLIKHVEKHPDADKIYCLKIDVSESEVRGICSGLVEHLQPNQLLNQKVCVLANLKAKKIRGIDSNGMVLCVSFNGKVELLQPPNNANIGELITWGDLKGEPDSILSVKSGKNPFEAVQKDLPFTTSSGVCSCNTLMEGTIS